MMRVSTVWHTVYSTDTYQAPPHKFIFNADHDVLDACMIALYGIRVAFELASSLGCTN
jgi:hypothetical protein